MEERKIENECREKVGFIGYSGLHGLHTVGFMADEKGIVRHQKTGRTELFDEVPYSRIVCINHNTINMGGLCGVLIILVLTFFLSWSAPYEELHFLSMIPLGLACGIGLVCAPLILRKVRGTSCNWYEFVIPGMTKQQLRKWRIPDNEDPRVYEFIDYVRSKLE